MSIISEIIDPYDGNQWEDLAHRLLQLKFGGHNYQKLPANHGGDGGLDGYTLDGFAFQCYAPARRYSLKDLYTHQRGKMTEDIGKFVKNETPLGDLIKPRKYSRWMFLVPEHLSKDLNEHAADKTREVIGKNCIHTENDFAIAIQDASVYFITEISQLLQAGANQINVQFNEIDKDLVIQWHTANTTLAKKLTEKIQKLSLSAEKQNKVSQNTIEHFLAYSQLISNLSTLTPEVYEKFEIMRLSEEKTIQAFSDVETIKNADDLKIQMNEFSKKLNSSFGKTYGEGTIGYLTRGVFADWLIRCPLDFP